MPVDYIDIPGFTNYNSNSNYRSLQKFEVAEAINFVYDNNVLKGRLGSKKTIDNSNWESVEIRGGLDFSKRDDAFYRTIIATVDGKMWFKRSDDADFNDVDGVYTELTGPAAVSPALANPLLVFDAYVFNDTLIVVDGANRFLYWNGSGTSLTLGTDPTSLSTNNLVAIEEKTARISLLDDGGRTHLGAINDPIDYTSAGTGSLNYGRTAGLKADKMIPFGDELIITASDTKINKFKSYRLLGNKFYDPLIAGSDRDQFEVKSINSSGAIIGSSTQEIGNDTIGLTQRGFVGLSKIIQQQSLTERDYISFPIKELITRIDFSQASKISSIVDYVNGRYLCAVPFGIEAESANLVLVYDFLRSSPGEGIYRWTVWTFGFGGIGRLLQLKGKPHITDLQGNIYELESSEANYADDGLPILLKLRTAALGSETKYLTKDFTNLLLVYTNISQDSITPKVIPILNGNYITDDFGEDKIGQIKIVRSGEKVKYDTGLAYDDLLQYDSFTSSEKLIPYTNVGGRGDSIQYIITTNEVGVSWGLSALSQEYEFEELYNENLGGVNASI